MIRCQESDIGRIAVPSLRGSPFLMIPKKSLEQELARLRELVENTPRLHRKDVQRLLGIAERTLTRRMKRADFPRPIYDAGRPKWPPSAFDGQDGQRLSAA